MQLHNPSYEREPTRDKHNFRNFGKNALKSIRYRFIQKFLIIVLMATSNVTHASQKSDSRLELSPSFNQLLLKDRKPGEELKKGMIEQVVSLAVDEKTNTIFAANYSNIFALNELDETFCRLSVTGLQENAIWNPTGVHFHDSLLYVANYRGNNLYVGKVNYRNCTLEVVRELRNKYMVSPENVSISPNGKWIGVANQDGNNVTLLNNESGKIKCVKKVPLAHGIEVSNKYFFATSLQERKITKNEISNCATRKSVGQFGNDVLGDEYMWPTEIFKAGIGKIGVVDAHQGTITIRNTKDLTLLRILGSNGPGLGQFNFPYASIKFKNMLYTADTMRNRILVISLSEQKIRQTMVDSKRDIWLSDVARVGYSDKREGYLNKETKIELFGSKYFLGYNDLAPATGELPWLATDNLGSGSTKYSLQAFKSVYKQRNLLVIFSPQSGTFLFLLEVNDGGAILPLEIELVKDYWYSYSENKLFFRGEVVSISHLVEQNLDSISAYGAVPETLGVKSRPAYLQSFMSLNGIEMKALAKSSTLSWIEEDCPDLICNMREIEERYASWANGKSAYINFVEYVLVRSLMSLSQE